MLGVDRGRAPEGKSLPDIQNAVHARQRLVVDIDPARNRLLAAPDVESHRPLFRRTLLSLKQGHDFLRVFITVRVGRLPAGLCPSGPAARG